ncbi:hypothetical protein [Streptomyces sp. NPDC058092]|uniref:hypothetical protein n=1 Tax=Streptomyces sp. NPDC058092 TaxID=3346336 RepID=UPI0036EAC79D
MDTDSVNGCRQTSTTATTAAQGTVSVNYDVTWQVFTCHVTGALRPARHGPAPRLPRDAGPFRVSGAFRVSGPFRVSGIVLNSLVPQGCTALTAL